MDNPNRHLFAISVGIIGGLIPNKRSNIHPYVLGCIFAILFSKILFGDYDKGFQFTYSDIVFGVIAGIEGILGAYLTGFFPKPL